MATIHLGFDSPFFSSIHPSFQNPSVFAGIPEVVWKEGVPGKNGEATPRIQVEGLTRQSLTPLPHAARSRGWQVDGPLGLLRLGAA